MAGKFSKAAVFRAFSKPLGIVDVKTPGGAEA